MRRQIHCHLIIMKWRKWEGERLVALLPALLPSFPHCTQFTDFLRVSTLGAGSWFCLNLAACSVNDCARICFRGRCSAAVYSPLRGECRLGSERRESCSNAPSTIRYHKQKDVKIQCFRCSKWCIFRAPGTLCSLIARCPICMLLTTE